MPADGPSDPGPGLPPGHDNNTAVAVPPGGPSETLPEKEGAATGGASPPPPDTEADDAATSPESGEASSPGSPTPEEQRESESASAPPLPDEEPPLPSGPPPGAAAPEDDGWDFHWDATHQAYFFHNRFTGATTWENPRTAAAGGVPTTQPTAAPGTSAATASSAPASGAAPLAGPPPLPTTRPAAGGYNPAIHGDYDPNAWYAQGAGDEDQDQDQDGHPDRSSLHPAGVAASFNRFTGQFQRPGDGPDRHSDEAKSRRQMNAFFDVDAAANAHDGRSLKAERSGKKISKSELKHFKEKRKARKEEKRRAWLRD